MILVKPSYTIIAVTPDAEQLIERAGRTCYKSEDRITDDSAKQFVKMILGRHHESVIEHASMSVKFIVDRGVTHELVRHRLASFSQESTRYCNYNKNKFGNQCTFVLPPWVRIKPGQYGADYADCTEHNPDYSWLFGLLAIEKRYMALVTQGWTPQQARSILPNSLKTEIVMTANFREWRHVFKLRCSSAAHPQMREIMIPLANECKNRWPAVFEDLEIPKEK